MNTSEILKTVPIIRDFSLNPSCHHGPTILFERDGKRFSSCSAYRSRELCQFYMPEEQWTASKKGSKQQADKNKTDVKNLEDVKTKKRSTSTPCLSGEVELGETTVSEKMRTLKTDHPLSTPNQRDKGEAQYHFNATTVQFFMDHFESLEFDSVLCVGTPSLHKHITSSNKKHLNSFLLDIDDIFVSLYQHGFSLYNMCNHHFFQEKSEYHKFLSKAKQLAVVVDPPFGVKVELIWNGCLSGILADFKKANSTIVNNNIDTFWIFPYFMEGHILSRCTNSSLKMNDFHVEYRNHAKYSGGSRSKSSPIRVFTTVPLSKIVLPEKDYRYCDICSNWVDKLNAHCFSCGTCTTKDGGKSYAHCKKCEKCVKPSWKHCYKCRKCHLVDSCQNSSVRQTKKSKRRNTGHSRAFYDKKSPGQKVRLKKSSKRK